jgi:hypothetical protein
LCDENKFRFYAVIRSVGCKINKTEFVINIDQLAPAMAVEKQLVILY